jgi:hypothetical protein
MQRKIILGLSLLASLSSFATQASYTKYTVLNSTEGNANLSFHQAACSTHNLNNVGAFDKLVDDESRGICLLKSISGTLHIDGHDIPLSYNSSGTSYGQFVIIGYNYNGIWSAKIVSADVNDGFTTGSDLDLLEENEQFD